LHDAFFNWFISQLTFARLLLTCILPPDLLEELDLSTLSIVPPDRTDGRLRRHRADVLFTVRTRSGKTVLLFLLLEHKSYRDPNASLQVLRYIVHLSEDRLRQKKPLHCILPVVLYNGRPPWKAARSLHQIFSVPPKCAALFPQFSVLVLDLPRMDDKILKGSRDFIAAAQLLRSCRQPDLPDRMPQIVTALEGRLQAASNGVDSPDSPLSTILRYASSLIPTPQFEQILDLTFEGKPMLKTQAIKSAAEEWFEQGREEGIQQGIEKGRTEGLQAGLLIAEIQSLQRQAKYPVSSPAALAQLSIENLSSIASTLRSSAQQN
jgi:predicted transposase/invertase (TIGR01784 family)